MLSVASSDFLENGGGGGGRIAEVFALDRFPNQIWNTSIALVFVPFYFFWFIFHWREEAKKDKSESEFKIRPAR